MGLPHAHGRVPAGGWLGRQTCSGAPGTHCQVPGSDHRVGRRPGEFVVVDSRQMRDI